MKTIQRYIQFMLRKYYDLSEILIFRKATALNSNYCLFLKTYLMKGYRKQSYEAIGHGDWLFNISYGHS